MSFAQNQTFKLWNTFMPRRMEIANSVGNDLFSIQNYKLNFFSQFDPSNEFEKWAAKEVLDFDGIPDGMEAINIQSGLYAVFNYIGLVSEARDTFQYILTTWLPASDYTLDTRPHFEILGEKYKYEHPESEEEIWIPIIPKNSEL